MGQCLCIHRCVIESLEFMNGGLIVWILRKWIMLHFCEADYANVMQNMNMVDAGPVT